MTQSEPTISSILLELAHEYDDVVAERDVLNRVLERRPSQAKDPYASIRNILRYEAFESGWVRLGGGKLLPRRVALQGLRFRVIPSNEEFAGDMLARSWLMPFVSLRIQKIQLQDATGRAIPTKRAALPESGNRFLFSSGEAITLDKWFRQTEFDPGDSILITVVETDPLTLRLEREPAAEFRANEVQAYERELIDEIAAQVAKNRSNMQFSEDLVLPIYARSAWRTAYPGRPWQQLVEADHRLRLLDGLYIADRSFRRPLDLLLGGEQDPRWEEEDRALLAEITSFQTSLLTSRREAAERGLWNGIAPRASTGQVIYDMREGTSQLVYPGVVDALVDHTEEIEQRVERGDFADEEWEDEIEVDELGELEFDPDFEGDELFGIEDIEDMQAFIDQNPALVEATQKLMSSLSSDEIEKLHAAETPDQVQIILTKHLNMLLGNNPALFAELTPVLPVATNGHDNGNGNGNGNGHNHLDGVDHDELLDVEEDEEWDAQPEDSGDWLEELDADEAEEAVNQVVERSNELMERFYQSLVEQGKSEATAASRTGDLWIYADFLSSYYNRSLEEGDYATLDECLFFYYPRKVLNNSARSAREMCTSFKQFYAFLRAEGIIADDAFAQAIWRRRDQAARVIELYDRIDSESPQFERLFAYLFAPYTA
jgi:hypothetical protein